MEADEVYSELSDKISDLTSKDSEFQGTIDFLQSSITELKNTVETMKTDLEFVKDYVQREQADSQAATDAAAQQAKWDAVKAQIQKVTDDFAAVQKAAADNAGVLSKIGDQIDSTARTIVNNAVDNSKKELLAVWEDGKKAINNSLSDYVTGQIKEAKTAVWADVKDFFGQADAAKPKPVLESDLEGKVKDIIASNQTENADAFTQKINDLITAYATTQGWALKS